MQNEKLKILLEETRQPFPFLFVTVSGAHLYGFESPDSDYDLRGAHIAPVEQVVSIYPPRETIEYMKMHGTLEVDLVTHDIKKYFQLMLNRNGYVLEQIFSPLVVAAAPEFDRLKAIASECITKRHGMHFLGFAGREWKEIYEKGKTSTKKILYMFRVLLVGIQLMKSGRVESNLIALNRDHKLSYIDDLIECKRSGHEKITAPLNELDYFNQEYNRLRGKLIEAMENSQLPEEANGGENLNRLLVRLRLGSL